MTEFENHRILIVEDNESIHADYRKILACENDVSAELDSERAAFFGDDEPKRIARISYELDFAPQGQDALELVRKAVDDGRPYALAFVDVRMPPGWDGVKTIEEFWAVDHEIQTVICTAFSDYSWEDVTDRLGISDRLLILKKPFDPVEVRQLAAALTAKWAATQRAAHHLSQVQEHAASLETINRELDRARTRAEAADRTKSEFLANVSHEIRTPMNAIFGFADLIAEVDMSRAERRSHGDAIQASCKDLLSILDDIVDISTLQAGNMEHQRERCSPYAVLMAITTQQREASEAAGLRLQSEFVGPFPEFIQSDPQRLKQVVTKLVDNAIKFTEHGGVTLRCSLETSDVDRPLLCIEVIDTGVGLDVEQHPELFRAFTQADGSMTRKVGGLGLGLAIAKSIAQMLGGDIELESTPGEGSCFKLTVDPGELEGRMLEHRDGAIVVCREDPPAPLPGARSSDQGDDASLNEAEREAEHRS